MREPVVALLGSDRERRVAHPEPRMPPLMRVRRGTAPVLREEQCQVSPRPAKIIRRRVEPEEDGIGLDAVVEPIDQPLEERETADALEDLVGLDGHAPSLRTGRVGARHDLGGRRQLRSRPRGIDEVANHGQDHLRVVVHHEVPAGGLNVDGIGG